jgi:hypothetical protein
MECLRSLTGLLPRAVGLPRRTLCALAWGLTPAPRPAACRGCASNLLRRSRAAPLCGPRQPGMAGTALAPRPQPRVVSSAVTLGAPRTARAAVPAVVPRRPRPPGASLGARCRDNMHRSPAQSGTAPCPASAHPPSLLLSPQLPLAANLVTLIRTVYGIHRVPWLSPSLSAFMRGFFKTRVSSLCTMIVVKSDWNGLISC